MDSWGTSEILELLLQIIQRKGFYATDTLEWISLTGIQICGSISDSSNQNISPRFVAIVRQLVME